MWFPVVVIRSVHTFELFGMSFVHVDKRVHFLHRAHATRGKIHAQTDILFDQQLPNAETPAPHRSAQSLPRVRLAVLAS